MSATMGRVRGAGWLALASLAAACGLDFDRFDPTASGDVSTGRPPDDEATTPVDGPSDVMPDAALDTLLDGEPVDASTLDESSGQFADGGCTTDMQCPVKAPYCNSTTAQCVECTTSTNCATTTAPLCSTNQQCVQCLGNADCSGGTPYCSVPDGGGGSCVQCLQSSQCTTTRRPTCTNGRCG